MLNENYHGEIYHFTSLIQASWIVDDDCMSSHLAMSDEYGRGYREDNRKYVDSETPFISFTRDKNYHIQGNNSTIVCFVFDGDSIQNIRNARLYPYAYNTNNRGESEERIFGVDIYPLHNYLKRIEITISDKEYSWASDRNFDEEGELYDEFCERFPDLNDLEISHKISDFLISKITNNKLFSNKVIIHSCINSNKNMNKKLIRLTESDIHRIVNESVKKVLKQVFLEATKNRCTIPVKKKLGKWYCIDGQWWDGTPYGLEHKGLVQDVRMYDKETNDDTFETIALFRCCDNKKFFYAQIVPIENSKDTKWKPLPLSKVPEIIKNDIWTINTQGHEPYPTCLT